MCVCVWWKVRGICAMFLKVCSVNAHSLRNYTHSLSHTHIHTHSSFSPLTFTPPPCLIQVSCMCFLSLSLRVCVCVSVCVFDIFVSTGLPPMSGEECFLSFSEVLAKRLLLLTDSSQQRRPNEQLRSERKFVSFFLIESTSRDRTAFVYRRTSSRRV